MSTVSEEKLEFGCLPCHPSGDQLPLNLGGSFQEFVHLAVSNESLDFVLFAYSIRPMDLNSASDHVHNDLGNEQLCDGRIFQIIRAVVILPCVMVEEPPGSLDL
jgi:hypothetical protein